MDVYVKQSVFPSCMANGPPANEAAALAATQRPLTSLALTQKSDAVARLATREGPVNRLVI